MLTCVVERFRRTTSIRAEASTAQLVCAECSVICDEAGLLEPSSQDLRVRDLFSKTRKPARAPEARNAGNSMAIDHDSELFKTVLVADSGEMCGTTRGFGNCEFQSPWRVLASAQLGKHFRGRFAKSTIRLAFSFSWAAYRSDSKREVLRERVDISRPDCSFYGISTQTIFPASSWSIETVGPFAPNCSKICGFITNSR